MSVIWQATAVKVFTNCTGGVSLAAIDLRANSHVKKHDHSS
jgi:hypothetical protein